MNTLWAGYLNTRNHDKNSNNSINNNNNNNNSK